MPAWQNHHGRERVQQITGLSGPGHYTPLGEKCMRMYLYMPACLLHTTTTPTTTNKCEQMVGGGIVVLFQHIALHSRPRTRLSHFAGINNCSNYMETWTRTDGNHIRLEHIKIVCVCRCVCVCVLPQRVSGWVPAYKHIYIVLHVMMMWCGGWRNKCACSVYCNVCRMCTCVYRAFHSQRALCMQQRMEWCTKHRKTSAV